MARIQSSYDLEHNGFDTIFGDLSPMDRAKQFDDLYDVAMINVIFLNESHLMGYASCVEQYGIEKCDISPEDFEVKMLRYARKYGLSELEAISHLTVFDRYLGIMLDMSEKSSNQRSSFLDDRFNLSFLHNLTKSKLRGLLGLIGFEEMISPNFIESGIQGEHFYELEEEINEYGEKHNINPATTVNYLKSLKFALKDKDLSDSLFDFAGCENCTEKCVDKSCMYKDVLNEKYVREFSGDVLDRNKSLILV